MLNDIENKSEEIEFKEDSTNIENDLKEVAEEIKAHKPLSESDELVSTEDKLQKELTDIQDKYLRLYSEFENYKRRTIKERVELFRSANQEVLEAMLPVLDDFERALSSMKLTAENKSLKEGVELIYNKLKASLIQKGIKEMEVLGKPFDPDFHEAITKSPAPSEDLKDKIIEVLEKGYFLNDKVIRFAKVIIGA
ncbi:MAG: nucleotide exchange factor GrpE [Bacteroidota bacterium]|nr:nucleotide exchange factor GrpE [Bacteroidota bacterium]